MRLVLWLPEGGAWHSTRARTVQHVLMVCHTINCVQFLALFSLRLQFCSLAVLFVALLWKITDPMFVRERGKKRSLHRKAITACSSEAAMKGGSQGCAAISGLSTLTEHSLAGSVSMDCAPGDKTSGTLSVHPLSGKRFCYGVSGFCTSLAIWQQNKDELLKVNVFFSLKGGSGNSNLDAFVLLQNIYFCSGTHAIYPQKSQQPVLESASSEH